MVSTAKNMACTLLIENGLGRQRESPATRISLDVARLKCYLVSDMVSHQCRDTVACDTKGIMDQRELVAHIKSGEGISTEFKRCGNHPGEDFFQTVCSFANRQGGNVFLGVEDDGTVSGVPRSSSLDVKRNVANVLNNPKLFRPAPLVEMEDVDCDGRLVIRVWVPMGPAVCSFRGIVYDRLADTDVRITGVDQISLMYLRKQSTFSERRIYPYVGMEDLRPDLIARVRQMAVARTPDHLWGSLDDAAMLRSAKLYAKDRSTGEEGFTLAAVLLLGDDDVIGDVCPAYKTDAVFRMSDADRYDDRLVVKTNLIEAYDLLSDFAKRHLPDRFVLDRGERRSARDIIVRELVSNLLIHREFVSPFPAKLIIDAEGVRTENASRALYEGRITLSDFNPMPKNPTIADVFAQIGRAEELGSGMRNLDKFSRLYSGRVATLADGDVFRASVPVTWSAAGSGPDAAQTLAASIIERDGSLTAAELAKAGGVSVRTAQRWIRRLAEEGKLDASERDPHRYVLPGTDAT